MSQPAGELLEEILGLSGERRFIVGVDSRGRIDIFVYSKQHDKVYQFKLESIAPGLKGKYWGYHLVGVGDEICAGDDIIDEIMKYGWVTDDPQKMLEMANKLRSKYRTGLMPSAGLGSEDEHGVFSSIPTNPPLYENLKTKIPKRIDGRLSSDLGLHLDRQRLGSSTYIA